MQDSDALAQSIVKHLLSLMRYSHRFGHRLRKEYGISGRRLSVLRYLDEHGEHSVSDISRYLNLRDGTTSPLVECLREEGLVTRRKCERDSRKVLVQVTDKGREISSRAPLTAFGRLRQELPKLSPKELSEIDAAIARVIEVAALDESLLE